MKISEQEAKALVKAGAAEFVGKGKIRMKTLSSDPEKTLLPEREYPIDIKQAKSKTKVETATMPKPENTAMEYPIHKGGGWYELSNGEKVHGKEEALKAQKALKAGDKS